MTVHHDEHNLTRREIRERERDNAAAVEAAPAPSTSRRVTATTSTTGGEVPVLSSSAQSALAPVSVEPTPSSAPEFASRAGEEAPAADSNGLPERTLTRRELRALMAQQEAGPSAQAGPVESSAGVPAEPTMASPSAPAPTAKPSLADILNRPRPVEEAPVTPPQAEEGKTPQEFSPISAGAVVEASSTFGRSPVVEPETDEASGPDAPSKSTFADILARQRVKQKRDGAASQDAGAAAPAAVEVVTEPRAAAAVSVETPLVPVTRDSGAALIDVPAEPKLNTALFSSIGSDLAAEALVEDKATEITGSFDPPVEHLQITEELDNKAREIDGDASFDDLISRGVSASGAVTTTNALILPSAPADPAKNRPVPETGEILVTGSIDLPRGLGSTGQHPNRYDSADVDRLFDQIEPEQPASDSAPVRASSAISTHTSTRGVIAPQQKKGVNLTAVLAITAAALLVGVLVIFGGFVLNIF